MGVDMFFLSGSEVVQQKEVLLQHKERGKGGEVDGKVKKGSEGSCQPTNFILT